jgi:hypothetical protein
MHIPADRPGGAAFVIRIRAVETPDDQEISVSSRAQIKSVVIGSAGAGVIRPAPFSTMRGSKR